jgi:CubicO group peptidase (beta-lactamase class C family)
MRRLLFPLLGVLGVLGGLVGLTGGATGANSTSVDQIVNESLRRWKVPGVAVVIVRDGRVIHLKGYGTKRPGADDPVTPDTLFPLASCTKAFTTTLMAMLADDRKLAWDDPVRKHLPSFHLSDLNADALVTLRDLVTHRTGYAGVEHDLLWYHAPWDIDETLRRARRLPPDGPFRASYHYSTILFMAAGKAAANRAGKPWDELVRERICEPLGMRHVAFTSDEAAKWPDRATGYRRAKSGKVEPMPPYRLAEPNPAGSLHATARDLAAWLRFHLADGVFDGKRLVSAANLNETKTPHTVMRKDETVGPVYPDSVQVSYAMGWVVYDHRGKLVVAHGGVADGFRAQVTLLPREKIGIALLNNLHQTKMNIALGNSLIDHLLGLPAKDWNAYFLKVEQDERDARQAAIDKRNREREPNTRPSVPLAKFVGEYHDPAYGTGKVVLRKGRLVWEWSSFRCPLEHFQDDTFRIRRGNFADQLVTFRVAGGVPVAVRALGAVYVRKAP